MNIYNNFVNLCFVNIFFKRPNYIFRNCLKFYAIFATAYRAYYNTPINQYYIVTILIKCHIYCQFVILTLFAILRRCLMSVVREVFFSGIMQKSHATYTAARLPSSLYKDKDS